MEVTFIMNRWRIAASALVGAFAVTAATAFAPIIRGQERVRPEPRGERVFRLTDWFGGQIGVTVRDAESGGVVVDQVREGSPAEKAGMKEQDVIVDFDGERVRSSRQFSRLVDETAEGRTVKMTVQRDGQRVALNVTPEARQFGRVTPVPFERFRMPERPSLPAMPRTFEFDREILPEIEIYSSRAGRLGVQIEDVQDQLAEYFGVKNGVLVTSVAKDAPAARAGIKAGDVITKINGETVEDTRDVRRELRRIDPGKEFQVDVVREKKSVSLKVTMESRPARRPGTTS
jgi:serine protease Do